MTTIEIDKAFTDKWPQIELRTIDCSVKISEHNEALWNKIEELSTKLRNSVGIDEISQQAAINSSRKAYRALGKDPARYRLSAEALMRRVVKGNSLYQINNVVDIVNLVSATTGFSIGGYDSEKIDGTIRLGIGEANEPYQAIGRGEFNIENLPVLRDNKGAFGSPTSDSVRTSVSLQTKNFLMVFFGFGAHNDLDNALDLAQILLNEYA
ncbi:MAG TPA: phenylalanine--tRNA ligase beta subunit-related protein [Prolixibacteraceae bacterium]|nr:phenylalanine--tRNA ligase beta subunit-related protein [Prolixibacteraceae bacterium]